VVVHTLGSGGGLHFFGLNGSVAAHGSCTHATVLGERERERERERRRPVKVFSYSHPGGTTTTTTTPPPLLHVVHTRHSELMMV
jgi:hypothetical protein